MADGSAELHERLIAATRGVMLSLPMSDQALMRDAFAVGARVQIVTAMDPLGLTIGALAPRANAAQGFRLELPEDLRWRYAEAVAQFAAAALNAVPAAHQPAAGAAHQAGARFRLVTELSSSGCTFHVGIEGDGWYVPLIGVS